VSWLPGTIHRLYSFGGGTEVFWIRFVHIMFSPLHGFFNSVVYGLTLPILRDRYKYLFVNSVEVTPFILSSNDNNSVHEHKKKDIEEEEEDDDGPTIS